MVPRRDSPAAGWQPLLGGGDAAGARAAIEAVVAQLDASEITDPSLADGLAGVALLHAYRARDGAEDATDRAAEALLAALDVVAGGAVDPWLFRGSAGIGWVLQHVSDLVEVDAEVLAGFDDMVLALVERDDWPFDYELEQGLVGLGVYALERGDGPAGAAILARVMDHLEAIAERTPAGAAWRNSTAWLTDSERAANPDGHHNLGTPHGATGVVGFLAQAVARAPRRAAAEELLDAAIRWLRSHDRPDRYPRYPRMIAREAVPKAVVDGWCYGEVGTAAMLFNAGVIAGRAGWRDAGIELAVHATGHSPEEVGAPFVLGRGFCHGAAGRAHIFNRMGQAANDPSLREAARAWYRRTLGQSPGGEDGIGLQGGSVGVALALLAAVSPIDPAWDRLFLVGPAAGV